MDAAYIRMHPAIWNAKKMALFVNMLIGFLNNMVLNSKLYFVNRMKNISKLIFGEID